MPSNQIDVNITIAQPQQDVTTLREIASALKQGTQGKISQTFGTAPAAGDYLAQQGAMSKELGLKMGGASIAQTAGGFQASASVGGGADEKERQKNVAGAVAGIGTVVAGIGAGFKTLLGMSKIFQTFMGTTGKILGTAVDMMLAPLMPIFTKIMVWIIQTVFPIATKMGKWLDSMFGEVGAKTAVAGLVAGYVGLKIASSVLTDLGTKLGGALLKHFDVDSFGSLIVGGIKKGVSALVEFGGTVGGYITDGFSAGAEAIGNFASELGGKIMSAFSSAHETVSLFATEIGGKVMSAFDSAHETVSTFATEVGGKVMSAFSSAHETVATFASDVGGKVMSAFSSAHEAVATFASETGGKILDAFDATRDTVATFASNVGGSISEGLKTTGNLIKSWTTTVGGMVSEGLKTTGSLIKSWASTVGGLVSEGLKTTGTAIKAFATTVGGLISEGLKSTGTAIKAFASTVGANIGAGVKLASGGAARMGGAIGGAMGSALMQVGQFSKMGGLIGVGIGAVALGAAIGYAMWKKYQEHQEGKDISLGKDRLQQVRYLQSMGMSEEQALTMQKAFKDEDISMSKGGIETYMRLAADMADQVRMFEDVNIADLEAMERGEQKLFAQQLKAGMYGDSRLYEGIIKIIKDRKWESGARLGAAMGGITEAIGTEADATTAKKELESRWYSWNMPVLGHMNLDPFGTAKKATAEDTTRVREALAGVGMEGMTDKSWFGGKLGTGGLRTRYSEDLTKLEAQMGFWLTAYQGNAASSFLTPEAQQNLVDKKYTDAELSRMAGQVSYQFNIVDQYGATDRMVTIGPADIEYLKLAISNQWELIGVTLP